MKAEVLVICDPEFSEYKLLIENLDRYLEPLIEFPTEICLHFDYDTKVVEDIIDYARVRRFDFKASTQERTIYERESIDSIIQKYDCAIVFAEAHNHSTRVLTDGFRRKDFKFRLVNYLKSNTNN